MSSPSLFGGMGPAIMGVTWAEAIVVTLLLASYLYEAWEHRGFGGPAVWWAVTSWAFGIGAQIGLSISCSNGLGNHASVVDYYNSIPDAVVSLLVASSCMWVAVGLGKVAAVLQCQETLPVMNLWRRLLLFALAAVNLCVNPILAIIIWFQCSPPDAIWNVKAVAVCAYTAQVEQAVVVAGIINAISDIILGFYPLLHVCVWPRRPTLVCWARMCILATLSVFAGACAIIKTVELHNVNNAPDYTYIIGRAAIWAGTEQWLVLIAISMQAALPIAERLGELLSSIPAKLRRRLSPRPQSMPRPEAPRTGNDTDIWGQDIELAPWSSGVRHEARAYRVSADNDSLHVPGEVNPPLPEFGILVRRDVQVFETRTTDRATPQWDVPLGTVSRATAFEDVSLADVSRDTTFEDVSLTDVSQQYEFEQV